MPKHDTAGIFTALKLATASYTAASATRTDGEAEAAADMESAVYTAERIWQREAYDDLSRSDLHVLSRGVDPDHDDNRPAVADEYFRAKEVLVNVAMQLLS